jgi:hypothetical protein
MHGRRHAPQSGRRTADDMDRGRNGGGGLPHSYAIAEDGPGTTACLLNLIRSVPVAGKQVHDANIVATMLAHGVTRLLTFNGADFRRFEPRIVVLAP